MSRVVRQKGWAWLNWQAGTSPSQDSVGKGVLGVATQGAE